MNPQITALLLCTILLSQSHTHSHTVRIIGGRIGGASVAHFLRHYSPPDAISQITLFERHGIVGGRLATVTIAGESFEAGGSIIHPTTPGITRCFSTLNRLQYVSPIQPPPISSRSTHRRELVAQILLPAPFITPGIPVQSSVRSLSLERLALVNATNDDFLLDLS